METALPSPVCLSALAEQVVSHSRVPTHSRLASGRVMLESQTQAKPPTNFHASSAEGWEGAGRQTICIFRICGFSALYSERKRERERVVGTGRGRDVAHVSLFALLWINLRGVLISLACHACRTEQITQQASEIASSAAREREGHGPAVDPHPISSCGAPSDSRNVSQQNWTSQ